MPLYEYFCEGCDGVFEVIRPMREASWLVPCPQCDKDAQRIMPTTFMALTMREGYARRIPDRGTYWHLGKEVRRPVTGGVPANEHPDLYRPEPPKPKTKGDVAVEQEKVAKELVEKTTQGDYESPQLPDTDKKYYIEHWRDYEQKELKKDEGKKVI